MVHAVINRAADAAALALLSAAAAFAWLRSG